MYRYFIIHAIRIILPFFFIKVLSQSYTVPEVAIWLEFLLYFQFSMQITESGISLSGPLIFQKNGAFKNVLNSILKFQMKIGLIILLLFLIFFPSIINLLALIAGIFHGLSLTWVFRFKELHNLYFNSEFIFRTLLYSFLFVGLFNQLNILYLSLIFLIFSIIWFFLLSAYIYKKHIPTKNFNFEYLKLISEGTALKHLATFLYPGLIIIGGHFFTYSDLHVLQIDKIIQGVRGLFGPIIDFLFPKSIKVKQSVKSKSLIICFGAMLSIALIIFLPLILYLLFDLKVERSFFMYIYATVPFLLSITHVLGTLGLVVKNKIKVYLFIFVISILSAFIFLYIKNITGFIVLPYLVLSLGLIINILWEKIKK